MAMQNEAGGRLKFIYCGYSKCGTKTIAEAFRLLDLTVYDFEESILYCSVQWLEFLRPETTRSEKVQILRSMFKNVDAVTDTPAYIFWELLLEAFPNAKCIFWEREEEQWLKSFMRQMDVNNELAKCPTDLVTILAALFAPNAKRMLDLQKAISPLVTGESPAYVKSWTLENYKFNTETVRLCYRRHNANFLRNCPENKRLVLENINCGFDVLCDFTGLKRPAEHVQWPHRNKNCSHTETLMGQEGIVRKVIMTEIKRQFTIAIGFVVLSTAILFQLF